MDDASNKRKRVSVDEFHADPVGSMRAGCGHLDVSTADGRSYYSIDVDEDDLASATIGLVFAVIFNVDIERAIAQRDELASQRPLMADDFDL